MYNEVDLMGTGSPMMLIIPQDPEMRDDLLNIDRNTKEDIRLKHRFYMNNDWEMNTIANTTIETLARILYSQVKENGVKILAEDHGGVVDFYNLLIISASYKENEKAEKTGNINIKFAPGDGVDLIIADEVPRSEKQYSYIAADAAYSFPEDEERTKAVLKIDKIARKCLADKYSVILPKDYQAIAVTAIFLDNLYRELINKVVLQDKPSATINFNDIIEFHAVRKNDKDGKPCLNIYLRPGMGAKLIIKSDESADFEDDGLDD